MPLTVVPFWLKLPQIVNLPVKLGRLGFLERHRTERARLGERRVDAPVVEDGLVLDEVAGGRDRVERAASAHSSG